MGMSLTTVAELRSTLGVGTLYPDATLQSVCDAADAVMIPMLAAKKEFAIAHSKTTTTATLYFDNIQEFIVGDSVVITNCGSAWNGTKTLTEVSPYSITYTISAATATDKNTISPAGTVTGDTTTDWTLDEAVQNAALMVSVDIWQARTSTLSGSNLVDFQPSPYRMSAQLLAKIRGMIAHALDARSMVG
jgi:hypothetical protein